MSIILEDLWLVCAVNRHGRNNWDSVASQLNITCEKYGRSPPPFIAKNCKKRYLAIRAHFKNKGNVPINLVLVEGDREENDEYYSDEESEKSMLEIMIEEFKQLRMAELRLENEKNDTEINSLRMILEQLSNSENDEQFIMQSWTNYCGEVENKTESSKDGENRSDVNPTLKQSSFSETRLSNQETPEIVASNNNNARIIVCALRAENSNVTMPKQTISRKKSTRKRKLNDGPDYNYSGYKATMRKEEERMKGETRAGTLKKKERYIIPS